MQKFSLFGQQESIRGPRKSMMGAFWYLGDGLTTLLSALSAASYGYIFDDMRATNVAFQILESVAVAAPTVLGIKLATGRESPACATSPGGKWHGYPGLKTYARNQPCYYSFPSGHVTTAVSTLVVITENYSEQVWLPAVGGTMVGLLMFALMNIGAHWPSDYPLAVLLGYTSANTVVAKGKAERASPDEAERRVRSIGQSWTWVGLEPMCDRRRCGIGPKWQI